MLQFRLDTNAFTMITMVDYDYIFLNHDTDFVFIDKINFFIIYIVF